MRVHHLNCGTHCPVGGALFDGVSAGLLARVTTHVLLIETEQGLVLIDTGYGIQDVRRPHPRLPHIWRAVLNVRLHEDDTALRQIEKLGFSPFDVRHIVLTHLDFDHAGGLEDFPRARVHVLDVERNAAERGRSGFVAHQRYRPRQWNGVREWRTYAPHGEHWNGFDAVRDLDGLPPEILMIPLRGHTAGHAGVAVQSDHGWLLHAGDAYFHHHEMDLARPRCTPGLAVYQSVMDVDGPARRLNQKRLRELKAAKGSEVRIFCAHDAHELDELKSRAPKSAKQP